MLGKSLLTNKKNKHIFYNFFCSILIYHTVKQEPSENIGRSDVIDIEQNRANPGAAL